MKVIVCVDDRMGMMFNKRRLSQDYLLIKDVLTLTNGHVWMNEYSSSLFQKEGIVDNDFLKKSDDYCFVENVDIKPYLYKIDELIIYYWNRKYPADMYFDVDLSEWKMLDHIEFKGNSHEKILRERYVKKDEKEKEFNE
ncbi:MAG: hypothetical protein K2P09_00625 [Erysipelotrichales bacterium]|nr:hypothetical protein [Erysipelotrichales bacterium]